MPPPRVELNLPPKDDLLVLPRAGFAPSTPMPPSWTASYSTATPRRPLTAADIPSSPASSSASQKFEVKRLLSRPADPMPSPRPLTTFDVTTSLAGSSLSETTVKRSNSASRFLRRRASKGHLDSSAPAPNPSLPLPRQRPHDSPSRPVPPAPYTPPPAPAATCSTLTPASAYALAYARRTNMTTTPSPSRPRHPFETVGTGRVVALGDPTDDSLTLSISGSNTTAPTEKDRDCKEHGVLGLTRKVSARFSRRKRAGTSAGVQSDAEAEDWSREKERAGMRAVGMSPVVVSRPVVSDQSARGRSRMSRHLSFENFSDLFQDGGTRFDLEKGRGESAKGRGSVEKERLVGSSRTRHDSTSRRDDSKTRREAARSVSTPGQGYPESRSTGTVSPENKTGGGKLWRLVKKMSTGTLKEKRNSHPEKVPPVPPLPPTLPSSRRSSVADYGEQIRPELAQFHSGSQSTQSSRPNTIHQSSTDSTQSQPHRSPIASRSAFAERPTTGRTEHSTTGRTEHTISSRPSLAEYRPSMTHTNESSVLSCSPKSSFGRLQSPRTSMSSYVDVAEDMPPPLPTVGKQAVSASTGKQPMPVSMGKQSASGSMVGKQPVAGQLVGKHIVAPGELAQYQHLFPPVRDPNASPSIPSPSLPPPKRPRKPRDKAPLPTSPASTTAAAAAAESGTVKMKPKPNVLRRPTRLDDDGLSLRTRSPRSASMGMPSPRSASVNPHSPRVRSRTQSEAQTLSPRPRSSSMGTVFTFRELGERKPLSEQEKVDKFEQLLEASDKAGGTLHARLQERLLLSDTMRLSYDGSSVSGL